MEQTLFLQYLLFGLAVLAILALAVPLLIWRSTSETARLLGELLEEQETTNLLLGKLLQHQSALGPQEGTPGPDDDYGPDEEYCPDPDGETYSPCEPEADHPTGAASPEAASTADNDTGGTDADGRRRGSDEFWLE